MNEPENTPESILKKVFGYAEFREGQGDVVREILAGRDALAVMPTGAGKSICYQVPALQLPGITIVVSPLVSLMKDQVGALVQAGVAAAFLNNSLTDNQKQLMIQRAWQDRYKIIYVAPERLLMPSFLQFAKAKTISMVTVDEAHCISQWGQDFRPSYLTVKAFVEELPVRPIISAFTATATARVQADIVAHLGLRDAFSITTSFDRPNLHFAVTRKLPSEKPHALLDFLRGVSGQSGIIYCSTTRQVDETAALLNRLGYDAAPYHAKLTPQERHQNQDDFLFERVRIMVATNAFGMGIDKSNVRFVCHYNMPKDLESYYQEAGRAGRDGEAAQCLLLYAASDVRTAQYFIDLERNADNEIPLEVKEEAAKKAQERLKQMTFYATTTRCKRQFILQYFGEDGVPCGNCSACEELARQKERAAKLGSFPSYGDAPRAFYPTADAPARPKPTPRRAAKTGVDPEDQPLLDALFQLRKELAAKQHVPAYVVFGDATLREICKHKPTMASEFLEVKGVGETKAARYGDAFMDVVRKHLP